MAQVALSIIGPDGAELRLASSPWASGAFRVMDGTAGLGLPVARASFTEAAGDGRRLGTVRTSGRQATLVIGIFADTELDDDAARAQVETRIDELADAISYVDGKPLPRLVARYGDGSSRELEFVHVGGGAEGLTGKGERVSVLPLALDCPDAYWTAREYSEFLVVQADDGVTFLETLPNVYLQPSDAFGQVTVANPGKVPSWVDYELHGPLTRVEAVKDGEGWVYSEPILAGETVYIRKTSAGIEVIDHNDASRYSALDDVPRFFQLPPGISTVDISVTGTTPETRVIGRYRPRFRQVF
jgi:hypothetical protein